MKSLSLCIVGALAVFAVPATAGKTEDIAVCMWDKMPNSANDFISSADQQIKVKGLMDGLVVCADGDLRVNTRKLAKVLEKTKPSETGPNEEAPQGQVCVYKNGECKLVEED